MCNFVRLKSLRLSEESVKGYKVAVTVGGRYYSPVTGIEYIEGKKIKAPKKYGPMSVRGIICIADVLNSKCSANDSNYKGLTAIFKNQEDANFKRNDWDCKSGFEIGLVLLEMTLSKELYTGRYLDAEVYLGSFIESIKEI
jgi:hypothetical protein